MLANLIGLIVGILALIGAGAFSYLHLEQVMGPSQPSPTVVVQKEPGSGAALVTKDSGVTVKEGAKKIVPAKNPAPTNGSLVPAPITVAKTVVEPGPLRVTTPTPITQPRGVDLSVRGVIEYTNGARAKNGGLPALVENEILDRDAQIKLDDMFAKQYFEHVSPSGVGPGDIAKMVGYAFVIVGENLALGDFGSDNALVEAWMNSPGHRANILNAHYQEIGVAVGKGMYEGRETWLAVQSFGTPISACPVIDVQKKAQLDANNVRIGTLRAMLDTKKAQIDATLSSDPNYNTYVNEFNALVPEYNSLVESTRTLVAEYNATVQAFNNCIATVGTETH